MPYSTEVTHFLTSKGWATFPAWYLTLQEALAKSPGFVRSSYHLNISLRRATICMVFSDQPGWTAWLTSLPYESWMETIKPHQTTDAKITPLHTTRGY